MEASNSWGNRFGGAALVTGASSGIGAAFAKALAGRGMDIVLVARRAERLTALAAELSAKHGVKAWAIPADLTQSSAVETLRTTLVGQGIPVGLVVNNAGAGLQGQFEEQPAERIAAMVDLNCRASAEVARVFAPAMVERAKGGLIFVASTAAYQPTPFMSVYGATKAFDRSLGLGLWAELSPRGVDVLVLSPGFTETEFQTVADFSMDTPGGTAQPDDVVESALAALGRKPELVHGARNALLAFVSQRMPVALVAKMAARMMTKGDKTPSPPATPSKGERAGVPGDFAPLVARMLVTFFAVNLIDLTVGSMLSHKLRFWFPQWLDPAWATRPDAWVVYSQSYLSGVFFIPFLAAATLREFFPRASGGARAAMGLFTLALLAFLGWWKGGLMVAHHKELEAVGWLALTGIVWGLLNVGAALPRLLKNLTARRLAAGLTTGIAAFFLVMALVDPLMEIGFQRMQWSAGLIIEVSFFVPAGLALVFLARRLRASRRTA